MIQLWNYDDCDITDLHAARLFQCEKWIEMATPDPDQFSLYVLWKIQHPHNEHFADSPIQSSISFGLPMFPICFPYVFHMFSICFPWFPMIFPWFSHDFSMIFPYVSHDFSIYVSHMFSICFPWFPTVFPWFSYDFPVVSREFSSCQDPASPRRWDQSMARSDCRTRCSTSWAISARWDSQIVNHIIVYNIE